MVWLLLWFWQGPGEMTRLALPDGSRLVVVEDRRVPLMRLSLYVGRGNLDGFPEAAWSGMHLDPEMRARCEALGLTVEPYISQSWCSLSLSGDAETLTAAGGLLADMLRTTTWARKTLKEQNQQARLRFRYDRKRPEVAGRRALLRRLFAKDDPRYHQLDKPERVPGVRTLRAVRDRLIAGLPRVIAVSGDVTLAEAQMVAARLPPARFPQPSRRFPEQPNVAGSVENVRIAGLNQTFFFWGRRSPALQDADYPAFVVADYVLGGHFHARLPELLRHTHGLTYHAETRGKPNPFEAAYYLYTYTQTPRAGETESLMRGLLADFSREGISEQERLEAIRYLRGRVPFTRATPAQRAGRAALEILYGLPDDYYAHLIERIEVLPRRELNRFIADFFAPERFVMVRVF